MPFVQKKGLILGIDPDIDRSGICILDRRTRTIEVDTLDFPNLVDKCIKECQNSNDPAEIYVEAGWMNKGNWHVTESRNGKFSPQAWAAAVGANAGACNAVSKLLIQTLEYNDLTVFPIKPLRKIWRGKDRKITHAEIIRELNLYQIKYQFNRTNQEIRDAILICLSKI